MYNFYFVADRKQPLYIKTEVGFFAELLKYSVIGVYRCLSQTENSVFGPLISVCLRRKISLSLATSHIVLARGIDCRAHFEFSTAKFSTTDALLYPAPLTRAADVPGPGWPVHRSSGTNRLHVPPYRLSTIGRRSFPMAAAHIWNSLPDNVVSATLQTFVQSFFFKYYFVYYFSALAANKDVIFST